MTRKVRQYYKSGPKGTKEEGTAMAEATTRMGIRTTEFWLSLAAAAAPYLAQALQGTTAASSPWAAAAIAAIYTLGRAYQKKRG